MFVKLFLKKVKFFGIRAGGRNAESRKVGK
jgi:hypothetical protein